jgi:hypothetical protein
MTNFKHPFTETLAKLTEKRKKADKAPEDRTQITNDATLPLGTTILQSPHGRLKKATVHGDNRSRRRDVDVAEGRSRQRRRQLGQALRGLGVDDAHDGQDQTTKYEGDEKGAEARNLGTTAIEDVDRLP